MPKSENQKQKLLCLKDFFERETDEDHPAAMADIISYLAAKDIKAERKSIYSDIQTLQDYGMDIVLQKGKTGGYYLASREFELPELKLLVDAVQSSKFLTDRKSMALIKKLEGLSSRHEGSRLRRQVVVSGRVKTMNESIYYNVDRIHDAIADNSQISFRYYDWNLDGSRHYREGPYKASPYALCWDDENYYLIAHSERHGLTHYRVDKMDSIRATGQERIRTEELDSLDLASYTKKVFGMFNGDETTVRMRFHRSMAGVVIDRFGHDCMLIPDGEEHFCFTTSVVVSPQFLGWVAGLGQNVRILYPESVVQEYRDLLEKTLSQYQTE
ncbi:MAG: WYL domain-containing protein [Oscillospiraceae bacterium]|nr:WYL domain-containing protein [Oscillospiraceae bacterium]